MAVSAEDIETQRKRDVFVQNMVNKFGPGNIDHFRQLAIQQIVPSSPHYSQMPMEVRPAAVHPEKRGGVWGKIERAVKKATPVAGAIAGSVLAPHIGIPAMLGSVGGGALAGSSTRNPHNRKEGAIEGAKQGAAYTLGSNLGSMLSNAASGKALMGGEKGLSGIPDSAVVPSAFSGAIPAAPALDKLAKFLPNVFGGIKELIGQRKKGNEEARDELLAEKMTGGGGQLPLMSSEEKEGTDLSALAPKPLTPFEIYMGLLSKKDRHHKEHDLEQYLPAAYKTFARGGHAHIGYIKESDTGGQDDDIAKSIPEGSYVMNATDVSLLGDGSSENGAKKLREFESKFARSGIVKPYDSHSRAIAAKVSNDEYVLSPGTVNALGKGNNMKGAKTLDKMRDNLRHQKGVAKILPPKSKDLKSYIRGGR